MTKPYGLWQEKTMSKTFVTKPFLPPREAYLAYVNQIFDNGILTNQGPMVHALENSLAAYLEVAHFQYVTNGTVALQLAIQALGIESGEIITTPFSYVATTSSILWQRCKPVFVDIEPEYFTMDPSKIEAAITPNTKAIMPVHVFGYACDVDAIQAIADKYNLKVIYDAAHAFASRYQGRSLVNYGDVSTLSFHATKLFHTIEGGACIIRDQAVSEKINLLKRFGHLGDDHYMVGINGKQSEFNAAMGLANFPHISDVIADRKRISQRYDQLLPTRLYRPKPQPFLEYNYAYYPVVFETEEALLETFARLSKMDIYPRRYFYPSLNSLPYIEDKFSCPISEEISTRIACLPLFVGLEDKVIQDIVAQIA
jgi:dTDP-4-amino-4,6-dideoxygalactose transaminase